MQWDVTTPPTDKVLTWASLSRQCSADVEDMDYIMDLLDECTAYAETKMECSLMARTITATYWHHDVNDWPAAVYPLVNSADYAIYPHRHRHALSLPRGPVISVTSVKDANGNDVAYTLERVGNSDRVRMTPAAVQYPVTVVYVAGYASADAVPADIRGAIRTHVATRYTIREAVTDKSLSTVTNLDEFYRLRGRGTPVM